MAAAARESQESEQVKNFHLQEGEGDLDLPEDRTIELLNLVGSEGGTETAVADVPAVGVQADADSAAGLGVGTSDEGTRSAGESGDAALHVRTCLCGAGSNYGELHFFHRLAQSRESECVEVKCNASAESTAEVVCESLDFRLSLLSLSLVLPPSPFFFFSAEERKTKD